MGDADFVLELFGFCIAAIAVAGVAWAIVKFNAGQRRAERLALQAWGMGFEISPTDVFEIPRRYKSFDWLSKGWDRRAYNVMHGRRGNYDVWAFDYEYHEKSNSKKQDVRRTLSAVVFDTDVFFPPLLIRPEQLKDKIASAVGIDDIDFESHEFSRLFYVKSPDKKFAYDVIHPRMIDFLMANRGWSIQFAEKSVMLYNGREFAVEEFKTGIDFVDRFLGLLPDYLWQGLREGRGGIGT